jgi:hypothetical protein
MGNLGAQLGTTTIFLTLLRGVKERAGVRRRVNFKLKSPHPNPPLGRREGVAAVPNCAHNLAI